MLTLSLPERPLTVLCLGAHSDDIEIGAGGTILGLIEAGATLDIHWCVLSASGARGAEARASAAAFLIGARKSSVECATFRDGYFSHDGGGLKDWFEGLKARVRPDLILTHTRRDAHQDHREVCRLTWNSFRDHFILEYEIPKWDGDLRLRNFYVPVARETLERKISLLLRYFATQQPKDWFDAETFRGLARLRGLECRAAGGFAEAFTARKAVIA